MNKMSKKFISCFLSIVMLFSLMIPAVCADDTKAETQDIPIITVLGTGNTSVYNADGERIRPDDVEIMDVIKDKEAMQPVFEALALSEITGNWDYYSDALYDLMAPIYANQALDKNGNTAPGDHISWSWSKGSLNKKKSGYNVNDYLYRYDERRSPMELAREFKDYVDAVSEVTGHEKVGINGRCYGSVVVSAYLAQYGDEGKIDTTLMYVPMVMGNEAVDAIFTGTLFADPDNIEIFAKYYLSNNVLFDDLELTEMIGALVVLLNYTNVLGLATDVVNDILKNIRENFMPRFLRDTYGRIFSNWSMVSADKYEEAKQFIFGGYEEEYAEFIKKLDDYHENVQLPLLEMYDNLIDSGMKFAVLTKYGTPAYPVFADANMQSDNASSLYKMSFGATTSPIDGVLSDKYIENAKKNGTDKYISADKKIDASTCRYPDQTWFVKNVGHTEQPACINEIIYHIFHSVKQPTVWDNEKFPQFTNYNRDAGILEPIEGPDESDKTFESNPLESLFKLLRLLIKRLVELFKANSGVVDKPEG